MLLITAVLSRTGSEKRCQLLSNTSLVTPIATGDCNWSLQEKFTNSRKRTKKQEFKKRGEVENLLNSQDTWLHSMHHLARQRKLVVRIEPSCCHLSCSSPAPATPKCTKPVTATHSAAHPYPHLQTFKKPQQHSCIPQHHPRNAPGEFLQHCGSVRLFLAHHDPHTFTSRFGATGSSCAQ